MATRPQDGYDFTVPTLHESNFGGAVNHARRIAVGKQLPAASARYRKRDAPVADRCFTICPKEEKRQIGISDATLPRTPLACLLNRTFSQLPGLVVVVTASLRA